MLRRNMKRDKPSLADPEPEFMSRTRRILNSPKLIPKKLPRNVVIREINDSAGGRGEWIENQMVSPNKTVVYFHGGGYVGGSVQTYRALTAVLPGFLNAKIFAVDYRLAPEYRFPAAVTDGLAAYRYVLTQTDASSVAFVGDSAGGGLLLATMLSARAAGLPLPRAAVCYSPYVDLTATAKSLEANEKSCVMFYADSIRRAAPVYLGAADAQDPLASPIFADLCGLPPLQIFASTSEVLLDDALRLAEKASANNVKTELHVWKNLPHVWPIFPFLPEARKALKMTADFIKQH